MTSMATTLDLLPFCGTYRYPAPFDEGEYTYATDARIIVRVPARSLPKPDFKLPHVSILNWNFADLSWKPLPSQDKWDVSNSDVYPPCHLCNGTGQIHPFKECRECLGAGEVFWRTTKNRYSATCQTCRGQGKEPAPLAPSQTCSNCVDGIPYVFLDGYFFAVHYLQLLSTLPDVRYAVRPREAIADLYFTFTGGCGILCSYLKS